MSEQSNPSLLPHSELREPLVYTHKRRQTIRKTYLCIHLPLIVCFFSSGLIARRNELGGMVVDLCAVLVLILLLSELMIHLFPAHELRLGAERMELRSGKKVIFSTLYRDCASALRHDHKMPPGISLVTTRKRLLVLNYGEWEPQAEGQQALSDALAARLSPDICRLYTNGDRWDMLLCGMRNSHRFWMSFLPVFLLMIAVFAGLRALCRDATNAMAYDFHGKEFSGARGLYIDIEPCVIRNAAVQEFSHFTLRLEEKKIERFRATKLSDLKATSGLIILWHKLCGTMPVWERHYREYAEQNRWKQHVYSLGTPYWEYTITEKGTGIYNIGFSDARGEELTRIFYHEKGKVHGGILMEKPVSVEVWYLTDGEEADNTKNDAEGEE